MGLHAGPNKPSAVAHPAEGQGSAGPESRLRCGKLFLLANSLTLQLAPYLSG